MDTQLNFKLESGNDIQTMYFVFVIKTRHKSLSCDNGKITRKEMSKLFLCDYLTTHYSMVKCHGNVNFEEINSEPLTGKNDRFRLIWGIFKEHIKQNIIMAMLRKANSNSVNNYRLIKNQ